MGSKDCSNCLLAFVSCVTAWTCFYYIQYYTRHSWCKLHVTTHKQPDCHSAFWRPRKRKSFRVQTRTLVWALFAASIYTSADQNLPLGLPPHSCSLKKESLGTIIRTRQGELGRAGAVGAVGSWLFWQLLSHKSQPLLWLQSLPLPSLLPPRLSLANSAGNKGLPSQPSCHQGLPSPTLLPQELLAGGMVQGKALLLDACFAWKTSAVR